jgi:hypothetical protein
MRYSVVPIGDGFGIHDEKRPCHNCIVWSKDEAAMIAKCEALNSDKLIKLSTFDSSHLISALDWSDTSKTLLHSYTKDGERIQDLDTPYYIRKRRQNPFYGIIHRDNLATSKKQAIANREAIYQAMCEREAQYAK